MQNAEINNNNQYFLYSAEGEMRPEWPRFSLLFSSSLFAFGSVGGRAASPSLPEPLLSCSECVIQPYLDASIH